MRFWLFKDGVAEAAFVAAATIFAEEEPFVTRFLIEGRVEVGKSFN